MSVVTIVRDNQALEGVASRLRSFCLVSIFKPDEVSMSSEEFGLTIRSVAELALVVSRAGDQLLDEGTIPTTAALRAFWQSSRRLQQRWL